MDCVVCLDCECMEFVIAGWFKVKLYDFVIWSWSKLWKILLTVIIKFFFWWFNLYWRGLKLRKWVTKDWIHMSSGLVCRDRGVARHWNCMNIFWWLLLGSSNAEKWGDQEKKFFDNNSLKPFKVERSCEIIYVMKVTQNGGQWKLYTLALPIGLNYSLCGGYWVLKSYRIIYLSYVL